MTGAYGKVALKGGYSIIEKNLYASHILPEMALPNLS
jgi:hypothetical protein